MEDDYEAYARQIAGEMARNGHQRLCLARGDVSEDDIADYNAVLESAADERPLQAFLQSRPGMLAQQLSASCRWVIPMPRLGAEYIPDFAVARLDSGGLHWTLVELESPRARLFTRQGRKSIQLDDGARQISDWRDWIAANRDFARRPKTANGLGLPEIDHSARGLVIIGRRNAVTDDDRRRLHSVTFNERINVHSYDWLAEEAGKRIGYTADLERHGQTECEDCRIPGRQAPHGTIPDPIAELPSEGQRLNLASQRTELAPGHAFISYVREDSGHVDRLQQMLEAAGVRVWRDTSDLWPGEDWRVKIRHAITGSALVFIACFSNASLARYRSFQNEELTLAIEQLRLRPPDNPWLIPVRFDECDIPDRDIGGGRTLRSIQSTDLFGDHFNEGSARLIVAIRRILGENSRRVKVSAGQDSFQAAPGVPVRDDLKNLILDLYSSYPGDREKAARRIGSLGIEAEQAVGPLIARLKDPSGPVRDAAVFALRMIGTSEAISAVSAYERK